MSIFDFFHKKATPVAAGLDSSVPASSSPSAQASSRRTERHNHRELLYSAIRDVMIRAGVLAASYKFKVLSLDSRGRQYLIMMDLLGTPAQDVAHLNHIETLITNTAKSRYSIAVAGVYWRINDLRHTADGTTGSVPSSTPSVQSSTVPAVTPPRAPAYEPLQQSEIEAFRQAQAANKDRRASAEPSRRVVEPADFEDTRMESTSPLSVTQYGDLN